MHKNVVKAFIASSLLLGLTACSDMAVDENEAIGMPSDFSVSEYVKINPDVKYQQIRKDLMDNFFYNKARQDSSKSAWLLEDGSVVISETMPAGGSFANDVRKAAKDAIEADNEAFLADTALAHEVFSKYIGFDDSLWVEELDPDVKTAICEFNKQQTGAPDVKEDKAFLKNFSFNEDLMANHYLMLGTLEGRAYRYCTKSDNLSTTFAEVVPDTLGSAPFMLDYSANRFCYDSTSAQKYIIQ